MILKSMAAGAMAFTMALGGEQAGAQTPIPPSARDFVMASAQGDRYEIMAAHLAEVQGQDAEVRHFAEEMIRDHTRMAADLRRATDASGLPPPDQGMSSDQAMLLSGLQGLRGADFDKAYARQQSLAHAQAVAVTESFADAGADPNLKQAAASALPTIRNHLTLAERLQDRLGEH